MSKTIPLPDTCTFKFEPVYLEPHDCRTEFKNAVLGWSDTPLIIKPDMLDGFVWTCSCGNQIPVEIEVVVELDVDEGGSRE